MGEFPMQLRVTEWTLERLLLKFYFFSKAHPQIIPGRLISKIYKNAHIRFMNIVIAWTQ